MKKIAIITGTRAEYGLLKPLITEINNDSSVELQIIATGAHLSHEFGNTYKLIEQDGFVISHKVEMLISGDTASAISKSVGLACIGFADAFNNLKPDFVIVLGDRYEILAATQVANVFNIPIGHIHGGELSEGAIDDSFRHAITKMSYLHFTATDTYKNRVIQLGEEPSRVFNVGAITCDTIAKLPDYSQTKLSSFIGLNLNKPTAIITYHSVTKESNPKKTVDNILTVLEKLPELNLIFTGTNADTNGRIINDLLKQYVANNKTRAVFHMNLGKYYLPVLTKVSLVIGNSSSGILEAPLMHVPTVNIGNRQRGRVMPESVISCEESKESCFAAIQQALTSEFKNITNSTQSPYFGEDVAKNILQQIKVHLSSKLELKQFHDV